MTENQHDHVKIRVADAEPGGSELVPARRIRNLEWELLRSPLYATGLASGDIVRTTTRDDGSFLVQRRGGNVCVQFYMSSDDADDLEATRRVAGEVLEWVAPMGGRIDGICPGLFTCTIPVVAGLTAIEAAFVAVAGNNLGSQWQFANVFDFHTGQPLNWWHRSME